MIKKAITIAVILLSKTDLIAQSDTAFKSTGNPIIMHKFTADPAALVYKDKVYLYTGHDVAPSKENRYVMHEWLCFSTTDMINWVEHPSPLDVKVFKWAKDDAW